MRFSVVRMVCAGALLALATAGAANAQTVHLVQPAPGAIVRETVPFRFQPGDLPTGGYVVVKIDGAFRTARVLPEKASEPVYLWDTKAEGANAVKEGAHTIELDLYSASSVPAGTATVNVQVTNIISPPSQDLKLVYHFSSQPHLEYHRISDMTVPGTQVSTASSATLSAGGVAPPDQTLQSTDLEFVRTTQQNTSASSLVRDIVTKGKIEDHGQVQTITSAYNLAPYRRVINIRGDVLHADTTSDFFDHIGFPVPQLPERRVGMGDSWQSDVTIPLNWDGSSAAHVTADCQLIDFEWQNNYPCAKILEKYTGPANFAAVTTATASGHVALSVKSSSVTYSRTIYFAYNSGRLVKTNSHAQITLPILELTALGGSVPSANASPYGGGYPGGGYPGGGFPGGYPGGGYPGGGFPGGYPGGGYPGGGFRGGYPGGGFPGGEEPPQYPGNMNYSQAPAAPVNAELDSNETTTLEAP